MSNVLVLLFFISCIVITTEAEWLTNENPRPTCRHFKYDPEEYELFSMPIDFYANPNPPPEDESFFHYFLRDKPQMKEYYNILPNKNTDKITFFGYTLQNPTFTLMFSDADDQISYKLEVKEGNLKYDYQKEVSFPADFAIEFDFAVDGVIVALYDMADEENPVAVISPTCVVYRAIPTGIAYMAVFTDCETVEFEKITMQTFMNKPNLYHMHIPKGLGYQYKVHSGYATIYLDNQGSPVYVINEQNGIKTDSGLINVLNGVIDQCADQSNCKLRIFNSYSYIGDIRESPADGGVYGMWFLCTEIKDKQCSFDWNVLL